MDEEFTQRLRGAGSVEEFIKIIDEADEEKAGIEERLETAGETKKSSEGGVKILAVTSCPTGNQGSRLYYRGGRCQSADDTF